MTDNDKREFDYLYASTAGHEGSYVTPMREGAIVAFARISKQAEEDYKRLAVDHKFAETLMKNCSTRVLFKK